VLLSSIGEYRRLDTSRFIDAVLQSADRWLANPAKGAPWITGYDFQALGPDGLDEVLKLWRRDAALWGAHLDDEDRRAIDEDLARHAEAAGAPEVAETVEPDASDEPGESGDVGERDEPDASGKPGKPAEI
jgi:hypothetical protein